MHPAASLTAALASAVALLAGCGEGGATRFSGEDRAPTGGGGTMALAIAPLELPVDPLLASSQAEQWLARQLYEPLTASLAGPYGRPAAAGLALRWQQSRDRQVWSFHLRAGVSFHDGSRLDAAAVRANADRWAANEAGSELLPGLVASDTPRPNVVRLIFSAPVPGLPRRLNDPRLGIVSAAAVGRLLSTEPGAEPAAGSGPFELRSQAGERIVLARWGDWWGSPRGLGPALDELVFEQIATSPERLEALTSGRVEVAIGIGPAEVAEARADPLLAGFGSTAGRDGVAIERSVRGISGQAPESLAGAWLAQIEP